MNETPTFWQALGYSYLSVFILSAVALLNLFIIPIIRHKPKFTHSLLNILVSLSIGSLIGDTVFHLLPEIYSRKTESPENGWSPNEWMVLAGIYVFFVFEKVLQHYHHGHGHGEGHNHGHSHGFEETSTLLSNEEESLISDEQESSPTLEPVIVPSAEVEEDIIQPIQSHKMQKTVGYLLLFSDTLHNLIDGLAIGVSFSTSIQTGISTSIAVLFHEIPHELGDYIILLSAGFPVLKALVYSILSNLSAFVGVTIGVLLNEAKGLRLWLLAFAAGNFMYLALADLVPELLHAHHHHADHDTNIKHRKIIEWIVQNLGIILGAVLMYLIKYIE